MSEPTIRDEAPERGKSGFPTSTPSDPQAEDAYWRGAYNQRPGYVDGLGYDDYAVAYRVGYEGRHRHRGSYEDHAKDLAVEWERVRGESRLTAEQAQTAMRDAWERVERQLAEQGSTNKDTTRNDVMDGNAGAPLAGAGLGAAGGAAAGAGIGTLAGPIGTAIGAVVGAVVGGVAGKDAAQADASDPNDAYWRENYTKRSGDAQGYSYESDYAVAYRLGYEGRNFYKTGFEDNEDDLKADWERLKGNSRLTWAQAKAAMREAWDRIESEMPVNAAPRSDF